MLCRSVCATNDQPVTHIEKISMLCIRPKK
uniref:Uncharacterized protein n=1 Tax=Serratia phage Spe5P4 TaxID=3159438 RepID=A0AAU7VH47_9CAUD